MGKIRLTFWLAAALIAASSRHAITDQPAYPSRARMFGGAAVRLLQPPRGFFSPGNGDPLADRASRFICSNRSGGLLRKSCGSMRYDLNEYGGLRLEPVS